MTVDERAAWHAQRATGIGGSDIAAILGLSEWSGPYGVWAEKVGEVEPDLEQTELMEFGHRAEALFGGYMLDRTGLHVLHEQAMLTHPEFPMFRCSLDGAIAEAPGAELGDCLGIFEGKTTDGREWGTDGIPIGYRCQGQWNMLVAGLPHCWFGVLHGRRFRVYEMDADREDQAYMRAEALKFWRDHVEARVAPRVDATRGTTDAIRRRWSMPTVDDEVALEGLASELHELAQLRESITGLEKRKTFLTNRVCEAMGNATEAIVEGRLAATWRRQTRTGIDLKRLRADHPDIAAEVTTTTTHRSFLVKTTKETTNR